MKIRSEYAKAVEEIVPSLFEMVRIDQGLPPIANMASSNKCHILTKGLHLELADRNLEVRREFHQEGRIWHYLIAHSEEGAEPREDDIVTDLNPWQFMIRNMPPMYTYFHGERGEVMERLRTEGAPDYFVALRGLATVRKAHSLALNDHI